MLRLSVQSRVGPEPEVLRPGSTKRRTPEVGTPLDMDNYDLEKTYKPVTVFLRVLGLGMSRTEGSERVSTNWRSAFKSFGFSNWLVFLFAHLYLVHLSITTILFTVRHFTILELSSGAQKIVKVFVSVVSIDHFFLHRQNIRDLLESSWKYIQNLDENFLKRFRRQYRLLAVGMAVNFIIGFSTLPRALHHKPEYIERSLYGWNVTENSTMTSAELTVAVVLDYAVFVFMDGLSIVLIYVFMGVCFHLTFAVRAYLIALQATSSADSVSVQRLFRLQRQHTDISELCQRTDVVFARVALTWYFDLVQRFLLLIPALLTALNDEPFSIYFGLLVNFGYFCYLFTVMSLSASAISETSNQGVLAVHEIAQSVPVSDWQAINVVINLVHLVCTSQMYLTGWNFFVIDRGLILTVCSIILTYTVVLLQFYYS